MYLTSGIVEDDAMRMDITPFVILKLDTTGKNIKDNNSVYLFIYNNILDFNLVPFKSINDAISQAVNYIESVKIIHKGRIIKWDVINNNTAFYINPYNKKIRIIKLEE